MANQNGEKKVASHVPMRQGDEYVCRKCHRRWGIDENPPPVCDTDTAHTPQNRYEKRRKERRFGSK